MKPVWTLDQVVAQLTHWGGKWDTAVPVAFMFYSQSMAHHQHKTGFAAFSEAERQSLLQSMQLVSDVANISFVNIPSALMAPSKTNNFLGFYTINDASKPWGGYALRFIVDGSGPPEPMGRIYGADIVMNRDFTNKQGGWSLGDYNARLLMHELLHGLGLSHAGDYNIGSATGYEVDAEYFQDSTQYTIMSYWGASNTGASHAAGGVLQFASTPLLYDVAALQKLYGANMATRTGDTVYGFNNTSGRDAFDLARDPSAVFTIWDAGGRDTLDLSGYATASRVDLREGAFSDAGGMTLNISIAYGARIENAVGGLGNDELRGNALDNRLEGGGGGDRLHGAEGGDLLFGGAGGDVFVYGGPGDSRLSSLRSDGRKFAADYLPDFVSGVDRIDLSALDADPFAPDDQAFSFIGTSAFSGKAGELRYQINHGQLELLGDLNGDGIGDFMIASNSPTLAVGDLIL
ncbi:MAG: M10 family metallopeptidase [Allosphingosinicella sp.]